MSSQVVGDRGKNRQFEPMNDPCAMLPAISNDNYHKRRKMHTKELGRTDKAIAHKQMLQLFIKILISILLKFMHMGSMLYD